jgi:hypothetical protein
MRFANEMQLLEELVAARVVGLVAGHDVGVVLDRPLGQRDRGLDQRAAQAVSSYSTSGGTSA